MKRFTKRVTILALVCVIASQAFFGLNVSAAATDRNAGTFSELTAAIAASSPGDTIIVTQNIMVTGEISINKSITIDGAGHSISVPTPGLSDAGTYNTNPSTFRVFNISGPGNTVSISNCTIKGGKVMADYDDGGGAIRNISSVLKLNNVTISNSQSGDGTSYNAGCGGGLFNNGGTMFLKDCNVSRNAAAYGGGFVNVFSGKIFIENSTFSENRSLATAGGGGAGENKESYLYINNSTFSNNKSTELGGAINNNGGQAYVINSTFVGNVSYSSYQGGAIANNYGDVTAVNSLFAYNYFLYSSTYILSDVFAYYDSNKINAYYCIFQNLNDMDINAVNCKAYAGNANGSDNTLVTGGILTKVLNANGTEVGASMVFQPYLCKRNSGAKTLTALLKNGSLSYGNGKRAGFTNGNGTPTIGFYNGSSWQTILGSNPSSYETMLDQNYDDQLTPRSVGAVITYASDLFMLKINAAAGGSFLGGSIYGDVYPAGTTVSLTAIADAGKNFVRWDYVLGGTGTASTSNPYTVTVDKNTTLVPVFTNTTGYTVSYYGNGNTGGDVPSAQGFPLNGSVTIPEAATLVKAHSVFVSWNTRPDGLGTDYAAGAVYKANQNLVLYAKWMVVITGNVTYSANGSTSGTAPADSLYQEGATVTVADNAGRLAKTGYGFSGWNTAADGSGTSYTTGMGTFVMGSVDVTLYAKFTKTEVNLIKTNDGFLVNIEGWQSDYEYQIWSYQQVTSDFLLGDDANVQANQWILSQAYKAGSLGELQVDGSINFYIPSFDSSTENYVIAVRIADVDYNFLAEIRDAYTPEDVGEVVITKVLVDGAVTTGYELREIKPGAQTLMTVLCNNVQGITYTAKAIAGPTAVDLAVRNTNEFLWDISNLEPGIYTVELTATNDLTTTTQTITFELFSLATNINYGTIDEMILAPVTGGVNITPTFANGTFSFRVREPGRKPIFRSVKNTDAGTIKYPITAPGVYNVYGYVTRAGYIGTENGGFDDGIIRTLVIPRTGSGTKTMTFTADHALPDVPKSTPIVFTAEALGLPGPVQYSFWRYDATGYVLVKDWSPNDTLSWTPARIGEYNLEARAKGAGAGSYEISRSLTVNITATTERKANITGITLNTADLIANAQPKKPIMLKANATGVDPINPNIREDDLLYKFYVYDTDMRTNQLKGYSVDQNCVWTPREAGTYTISVLVKNDDSFGKFDAIASFDIVVK